MKNPTMLWLLVLLAVLGGLAVWRFLPTSNPNEMSSLPDTPDTVTTWMCVQCSEITKLTARQVEEWRNSDRLTPERGKGTVLSFKCLKCGTFTIVGADHCDTHDVFFAVQDLSGKMGDCPECVKAQGGRR